MPNPLSVEKFSGEFYWFCKTLFIIWNKSTLTGVGRNIIIKYDVSTLNIQQKNQKKHWIFVLKMYVCIFSFKAPKE
jgi:hypothetical protein